MFLPKAIYYEKAAREYELGKKLLERYEEKQIPMIEIENHNNIPEMRNKENSEFANMKQNLIIGVRKTHRFVPNQKTSDFLVPYTSSGCIAMCMYCYLVCNYNKCSYLRLFVNREQMLDKIIKVANQENRDLTFEIGSNSDLTLPTKFDMVDSLLPLNHRKRTIIRMSLNPQEIINKVEFGTSRLKARIEAINKLADADYPIGILIAPVILVENWKVLYEQLIKIMAENLNPKVKKQAFFEIIFMTYSYVHRMINKEAFPMAIDLYQKEIMTVRGKGKYRYQTEVKQEAEVFLRNLLEKYFPENKIWYVV